jgi:CRISPR-associated protein Csm5
MSLTQHTQRVQLHITPLTPVHIGCGEDYDPTGYVIDEDGLLFPFDPAAVPLGAADRNALLAAVNRPGGEALLAVQRFFRDRADACKGAARNAVRAAPGVVEQYRRSIGQVVQREAGGKEVANQLVIERTTFHPHTGMAYLPGSSIKGAMRTAWLDGINQGRPAQYGERANALEKRLLEGGAFHTDPFRLLSVGDAAGQAVGSQIYFSTNHKKRPVFRDGGEMQARGPVARRECIAAAQHAALSCTLALEPMVVHVDANTPKAHTRIQGWQALADACNRYYLPRLEKDLALLDERRFGAPRWLADMRALLSAMRPAMEAGKLLLLRVGRHSGAENVTLDGVRSIRIMKGPGQSTSEAESTTVWLAAAHENARSDLLPFGWLAVHVAECELHALKDWCAAQPNDDLEAIRGKLASVRAQAAEVAAELAKREAGERAEAHARNEALAREQALLASLTDAGRDVQALRGMLNAHTAARKQPVGGQLYQATRQLIAKAEQPGAWAEDDRAALAELLLSLVPLKIDLGGKAKEVKQAATRLTGQAGGVAPL